MLEPELKGHVRSKTLLELAKLRRYIIQHWDQPEGGKSAKTLSQRFACSPSLSAIRAYAFGGKESTGATIRPTERQGPDGYVYDYTTIDNSDIDRHCTSYYTKDILLICVVAACIISLVSIIYILHKYSINL